jgi:hypothetical protein
MNLQNISIDRSLPTVDPLIFFSIDKKKVRTQSGTLDTVMRWWQVETTFNANFGIECTTTTQSSGHYAFPSGTVVSHPRDAGTLEIQERTNDFPFDNVKVIGFTGWRNLLAKTTTNTVVRASISRPVAHPLPNSQYQLSNINYQNADAWAALDVLQIIPSHNTQEPNYFTLRIDGSIAKHTASGNPTGLAGRIFFQKPGTISIALVGPQDNILLMLDASGELFAILPTMISVRLGIFAGAKVVFASRKGVVYLQYDNHLDALVLQFDIARRRLKLHGQGYPVVQNLASQWSDPKHLFSHPHEQLADSYCVPLAINSGQTLQVYSSSSSPSLSVQLRKPVFSIDTTVDEISGLPRRKLSLLPVSNTPMQVEGHYQSTPSDSYQNGCQWRATQTVKSENDEESGFYFVSHTDATASSSKPQVGQGIFIIRGKSTKPAKIKLLANTHTWDAYNYWGGRSGYFIMDYDSPMATSDGVSNCISLRRPYVQAMNFTEDTVIPVNQNSNDTLSIQWRRMVKIAPEMYALQWLKNNGFAVDVITDGDLDLNPVPAETELLLLAGHPEYWTAQQYDHVYEYIRNGGKMINMGGNHCFTPIFFNEDRSVFKFEPAQGPGISTSVYDYKKFFTSGRGSAVDESRSSYTFADGKVRSQTMLFGNAYSVKGFNTWAGLKVTPTGVSHRFLTGSGIVGGQPTQLQVGDVYAHNGIFGGGSGRELDVWTYWNKDEKPVNVQILSKGINDESANVGSEVIYHEINGGWVLSFGSNSFAGVLGIDNPATIMVLNAVRDAMSRN